MNHCPGEGNRAPSGAIEAAHRQAAFGALLVSRREPLAIAADGAFAQLRATLLHDRTPRQCVAVDGPQAAAARDHQRLAIGVERRRKWMYGCAGGELTRLAAIREHLEELRRSGAIRSEEQGAVAGKEGALQKVSRMADGRAVRDLAHRHDRPRYRSRPFASAAILRSATERFNIQKPQSGWIQPTRPAPSAFPARASCAAISSAVST